MRINWVDILIVIYVTRAFFLGKKRGLSVELLALIVALLTWIFALHFYQPVSSSINEWLLVSVPSSRLIAFLGFSAGVLFLGTVFVKLLKKIMNLSFSSNVEQVGGLFVGGMRGGIITAVIIVSAVLVPADFMKREFYTNSLLGNYLIALSPKVHKCVWADRNNARFSRAEFIKSLPHKPKGEVL